MRKKRIAPEKVIEAVHLYLNGQGSMSSHAKELGIKTNRFHELVVKYETFGPAGLSKGKNLKYSAETKRAAVTEYLSGGTSQAQVCKKYKIKDRTTLRGWLKVYTGHKELRPSRGRGSERYMTKGRATTYEERIEIVSYCIEHRKDYIAAIQKYGVSYQQIYSWVRKYEKKGAEGLLDQRGKRKPESEMTELELLKAKCRLLEAKAKRLETENAILKKLEELERRGR